MDTMRVLAAAALAAAAGAATGAGTATAQREHGAHAHGHGALEVALDGATLHVTLRMPAVNVIGFEHAPSTEEQHRAVDAAFATFARAANVVTTPAAAGCSAREAAVSLDLAGDGHGELEAAYRLECASPGQLDGVAIEAFAHLRGAEAIDASVVTSTYQGAAELTPARTALPLRR